MSAARIRVTAGPDVTNASRLAIGDEVDVDRFDVSGGAWVRVDEGDVYTLSRDWFDIIEVTEAVFWSSEAEFEGWARKALRWDAEGCQHGAETVCVHCQGTTADPTLTEQMAAAWATVEPGHRYTRERFSCEVSLEGKFVGHTPAALHEAALDVIIARLPDLLMEVDGLREVVATLNGEVARLNDLRSMHEMAALEAELTIRRLTTRTALTLDDLVLIGEKAMRRETWKVPHLFAKAIVDALGVELPEANR